jgi:hypothetical protein
MDSVSGTPDSGNCRKRLTKRIAEDSIWLLTDYHSVHSNMNWIAKAAPVRLIALLAVGGLKS